MMKLITFYFCTFLLASTGCSIFKTIDDDSLKGTVKRFKKLPEDTLVKYTRIGSPFQKLSAYRALIENEYKKSFDLLLEHLHDTDEIEWAEGCMIESSSIFDLFLESTPLYKNKCDSTFLIFNCVMKDSLHTIYLQDTLILSAYYDSFITNTPITDKFYPLIRNAVVKHFDVRALVALSNYRKPEDIPLMHQYLYKKWEYIPYKHSTTWYQTKIEMNYIKTKEKVDNNVR